MKFQKLTIHNIASIEDAVIDFEEQPLSGSEVFLITGKTGAGKSTILDAICLALYADTPRLDGTKMEGDANGLGKEIKVNDPRQLIRQNTSEAFARLTFTGSNGIRYESEWSVARAHKKLTGAIQNKKWQLRRLDGDYTWTKDKEIQAEIQQATGLDFSQFCRTTMLAQGEFTRFLNSKNNEKAEILEKITGVDAYSKIGAKIYAVTKQKENELNTARQLADATHTLSDEEIEEKNGQLESLDLQRKELITKKGEASGKREWLNTEKGLATAVNGAAEAFSNAKTAVESDEFKAEKSLVNDWKATIEVRGWLTQIVNAENDKAKQEKELERLANDYAVLLGGLKFEEQRISDIKGQIQSIDEFLQTESPKAAIYDKEQTISGYLRTINQGRIDINNNQDIIAKEKGSLTDTYSPAFVKAKNAYDDLKDNICEAEKVLKVQESALEALGLAKLRSELDAPVTLLYDIGVAKDRLKTLDSERQKRQESAKILAAKLNGIEAKKNSLANLEPQLQSAKSSMDERKVDLEKQKDTVDKFAKSMRLKLQVGCVCPVCLQKVESELPKESELAGLVQGLQDRYDEAEKKYNGLNQKKTDIEAEIKAERSSYDTDKKTFDNDHSVEIAENNALNACQKCGIDVLDDACQSKLDSLKTEANTRKSVLEGKIGDAEKMETQVNRLRKELNEKRNSLTPLEEALTKAGKGVDDCKGRIATAKKLVEQKEIEVSAAEQNVRNLVTTDGWDVDWMTAPLEFATLLAGAAKTYNKNTTERDGLVTQRDKAVINHNNVLNVQTAIVTAKPEWNEMQATNAVEVENLMDRFNRLNNNVTVACGKISDDCDVLKDVQPKLDSYLESNQSMTIARLTELGRYASASITEKDSRLTQKFTEVDTKKVLLDNISQQHTEHQEKKPELADTDTVEMLDTNIAEYEKQINDIAQNIGAIKQELSNDKKNKDEKGKLIEEADARQAEYKKWSRLNELLGDAQGKKFREIAQSYVLASLIHSANSYMKTLTDRYTLKGTPGTFVISIEDAYQGFASRPASTISGGESFLVSLSLALALSDIGQTISADTLFIDEGFGTLSGEPLQNAINTLRSLHSKSGRHVGIISHIEELKERIPVQIQVNQEGNNSNSTIAIVGH